MHEGGGHRPSSRTLRLEADASGYPDDDVDEARTSAADFFPKRVTLRTLAAAAEGCRGCDLYRNATQTVFGEGPWDARIMLVGEQPGDREDVLGRPFVGPAGALLDRALRARDEDRDDEMAAFVADLMAIARKLKSIRTTDT